MTCPSCGRPVAVARASCLYCGAALPQEAVARAEAQTREVLAVPAGPWAADAPAPPDRGYVVLDLDGAEAVALVEALGLSAYEAGQRVRGGGLHLHRVAPRAEAEAEQGRLTGAGLLAWVIPEAELRAAAPLIVLGGTAEGGLRFRHDEGEIAVEAPGMLLVVRGPIARERTPSAEIRRQRLASPEPGYRFHLHRRDDPRPLELDPEDFDFGPAGPVAGSSMLELSGWVAGLAEGLMVDDRFRRLPPVFAPAAPERRSLRDALTTRVRTGPEAEAPLLDNLGQFRAYSGWRAAVERRRASGPGRIPSPRP